MYVPLLIHHNDTIDEENDLNGMKSDCGTASRKRKLGKLHGGGDGSKKEEEAEVDATKEKEEEAEVDTTKEKEEDTRNFKLVTNLPQKL